MKKLWIVGLLAIVFATGCKDKDTNTIQQQEQGTLPDNNADTIPPAESDTTNTDTLAKGDTGKASLDWTGNYAGNFPCGDCQGIMTKITINDDNTYTLSSQYVGKEDEPTVYKGKFNWDKAQNVITLDAEGDHLKFKVMENMLKKLDKFGNDEQYGPKARWFLHKTV